MTIRRFMASGDSIDDAFIELKEQINNWNEQEGNRYKVPKDATREGISYKIEVRAPHEKYISGDERPKFKQAYAAAVDKIEPEKLTSSRFRITARYDLQPVKQTPAVAGSPSGAAPYDRRAGRDITGNML